MSVISVFGVFDQMGGRTLERSSPKSRYIQPTHEHVPPLTQVQAQQQHTVISSSQNLAHSASFSGWYAKNSSLSCRASSKTCVHRSRIAGSVRR
jgi:hypothetical protein